MQRKSYSKKTIAVFDIVGSFFVDVFYNHLYSRAVDGHNAGEWKSTTDGYRTIISTYVHTIANDADRYRVIIKKLSDYYRYHSNFTSIAFHDFQDRVLSQFIPAEYYGDFNEQLKDRTLHTIVSRVVRGLAKFLINPTMLQCVIDAHADETNVSILQDCVVDDMILVREEYYSRFAEKVVADRDTVSKSVLVKMKQALTEETRLRCKAEDERDRCLNIIAQLVQQNGEMKVQLSRTAATQQSARSMLQQPAGQPSSAASRVVPRSAATSTAGSESRMSSTPTASRMQIAREPAQSRSAYMSLDSPTLEAPQDRKYGGQSDRDTTAKTVDLSDKYIDDLVADVKLGGGFESNKNMWLDDPSDSDPAVDPDAGFGTDNTGDNGSNNSANLDDGFDDDAAANSDAALLASLDDDLGFG